MKITRIPALLLLFALSLVYPVAAQPAPQTKPASPPAAGLHSLWRVQGKSNVVYLLGSIHLLKPGDYPLAEPIERAFTNSEVAAFEADIGEMDQPGTQLKILGKAQLPEGESLKDQLSAGVYASLSKHAEQAGMPMMMLDRFKPVMAVMTLEVVELLKLGLDPEHGMDKHFFGRAREDGKEIVPLETVDFQIGLVTDFSKEEGELLVKTTLDEIDNTKKLYDDMLAAWRTGDSAKLAALLNDAMEEAPVIYKRLVSDRNRSWVPKIEALLRGNKNAIVIVGAGHLVGTDGVVELLKKKGFKVTQL